MQISGALNWTFSGTRKPTFISICWNPVFFFFFFFVDGEP